MIVAHERTRTHTLPSVKDFTLDISMEVNFKEVPVNLPSSVTGKIIFLPVTFGLLPTIRDRKCKMETWNIDLSPLSPLVWVLARFWFWMQPENPFLFRSPSRKDKRFPHLRGELVGGEENKIKRKGGPGRERKTGDIFNIWNCKDLKD